MAVLSDYVDKKTNKQTNKQTTKYLLVGKFSVLASYAKQIVPGRIVKAIIKCDKKNLHPKTSLSSFWPSH